MSWQCDMIGNLRRGILPCAAGGQVNVLTAKQILCFKMMYVALCCSWIGQRLDSVTYLAIGHMCCAAGEQVQS